MFSYVISWFTLFFRYSYMYVPWKECTKACSGKITGMSVLLFAIFLLSHRHFFNYYYYYYYYYKRHNSNGHKSDKGEKQNRKQKNVGKQRLEAIRIYCKSIAVYSGQCRGQFNAVCNISTCTKRATPSDAEQSRSKQCKWQPTPQPAHGLGIRAVS